MKNWERTRILRSLPAGETVIWNGYINIYQTRGTKQTVKVEKVCDYTEIEEMKMEVKVYSFFAKIFRQKKIIEVRENVFVLPYSELTCAGIEAFEKMHKE